MGHLKLARLLRGTGLGIFLVCSITVCAYAWPIPDTGQTGCYDASGNGITCPQPGEPFYGQDGNYTINPPSYTKLDAGGNALPESATSWVMVRDNVTGLIWEAKQNKDGVKNFNDPHDADNTYTWYDTETLVNAINVANFGGHSDWRLPTIKELESIADLSRANPSINTTYFPKIVTSNYYWSSTIWRYGVWSMSFHLGYDYDDNRENYRYVLAVRGGQQGNELTENGDGTVTDTSTGLMWQQAMAPGTYTWEQALSYCEDLTLAGHLDWRLPTRKELRSIMDYSRENPAINTTYFPNTVAYVYYSSTSSAESTYSAWCMYLYYGGNSANYKSSSDYYVRAVRGGQVQSSDHLIISSPAQASRWAGGNIMPITWDTADLGGNVKISLSRDGGRTFETIADSNPNDGTYDWMVTGSASVNCALKIEPLSDPAKATIQSLFTIEPDPNDTDADGLPDTWEQAQFGNLNQTAEWDADGDGLTNLQEYQNNTNPNSADSDIDGMPDGWEMAHGLNPNANDANQDADGDGFTNAREFQDGTDPQSTASHLVLPQPTGRIPDTGQTKCYDDPGNEITCPQPGEAFYGQDGNYTINPPQYIKMDAQGRYLSDNATVWAMVYDVNTGLIWEMKTDDGSIHDKDNTYTWYDSNPVTNGGDAGTPGDGTDTEDFIAALNAANFGGFSEWRLPTIKELESMVDLSYTNPSINITYFPNTVPSNYWSSTTYSNNIHHAWNLPFYAGYDSESDKSGYYYVRAVRGGQRPGQFIDNGDQTVTDSFTGLMWQQYGAVGTWEQALFYCEGLTFAGHSDWRLPTKKELRSIVNYSRYSPTIDATFFPNTPVSYFSDYWSSTTPVHEPPYAWTVDFDRGGEVYRSHNTETSFRAVRGGQVQSSGHLIISSPAQASIWGLGSVMPITWDTAGLGGNVKISLSHDGGKNFETIAASTPNDGTYDWTVVGSASVNCVLKIEPLNDPSKGTFQGLFSITPMVDLDSDGLPDTWEQDHFGNLNQTAGGDADSDGLTNLQEFQNSTNPNSADSDDDGLSDAWELANGSDPLITGDAPPQTVAGTVRNADGTPLQGVSVAINVYRGTPCGSYTWVASVSSSSGAYLIQDLDPSMGPYYLKTHAYENNYVDAWWNSSGGSGNCSGAQAIDLSGGGRSAIDFRLEQGGVITGIVVRDSDGQPITGLWVQVSDYSSGSWFPSAQTQADGSYALSRLPSGNYRLQVSTSGTDYVPEYYNNTRSYGSANPVSVVAGQTTPEINFSLALGGSISGVVTRESDGQPIAGVWIQAYDYISSTWGGSGQTQSDGSYTIRGLPAGSYRVQNSWASGYVLEYFNNAYLSSAAAPVYAIAGQVTSGTHFALAVDSDTDNMGDQWETTYFGNLSQSAYMDLDGDGLNNLSEFQISTDPTMADTDGDHISDSYEVNTARTNPNDPTEVPPLPFIGAVEHAFLPDGSHKTYLHLLLNSAFVGNLPGDLTGIKVTAPSGAILPCAISDFRHISGTSELVAISDGAPEIGVYTFGVTSGGLTGVASDLQTLIRDIPVPDASSLSPAEGTTLSSKTPSFSWGGVDLPGTPLFYRVKIEDTQGDVIYSGQRQKDIQSCAVPTGKLLPGRTCRWRVEVFDDFDLLKLQNRSESAWLTFTMADTLTHSSPPAFDPDQLGAFTLSYNPYSGGTTYVSGVTTDLVCSVAVVDIDGVAWDGKSHTVSLAFPTSGSTGYPTQPALLMSFDFAESATKAYYYASVPRYSFPGGVVPSGDYTFTVTDPDGNVTTTVDHLNVNTLPPPNETTFTPSLMNPVSEHITATFDNVHVNGTLYDDFGSYSSIYQLDPSKWYYPPSGGLIEDAKLSLSLKNVIGQTECAASLASFANISSIRADIAVPQASPEYPYAQMRGIFYSNGLNDVIAALRVTSSRVYYVVIEPAYSSASPYIHIIAEGDLLSVNPGQTVNGSIAWNGSALTFEANGSSVVYTPPGAVYAPISPSGGFSARMELRVQDTTPTFTWEPVPGASRYRVRVYSGYDSRTIWNGYTGNETTYTLPPGVLLPNGIYRYRIEAWDSHNPMEADNISYGPYPSYMSQYLYPMFMTGSDSAAPLIHLDSVGVQTWTDETSGSRPSFWIKVYDAQGVPGDIRHVKVRFPSGEEEVLYYDEGDSRNTPTCGVYRNMSALSPVAGTYTFTVEDMEGNTNIVTENLTPDPIGYPSPSSLIPADGAIINDTAVDFDWEDVPGAAFYQVEIYDENLSRIYLFATTASEYHMPAGFLEEGKVYRYRITTRREFLEQNVDNGSGSPPLHIMPAFMTTLPPPIKGDMDGNGYVDLADAILALQVVSGCSPSEIRSNYPASGADVNGDDKIGIEEVVYIMQAVAGLGGR